MTARLFGRLVVGAAVLRSEAGTPKRVTVSPARVEPARISRQKAWLLRETKEARRERERRYRNRKRQDPVWRARQRERWIKWEAKRDQEALSA